MTGIGFNRKRLYVVGLALTVTLGACPKDPNSGKPRIASLHAKEWQSRLDKVDTLAEARSPETLAKLVAATRDSHPKVRTAAVKALARRQDRSVIPVLARCVKDTDFNVRIAAVEGLQQYTGARAVYVVLVRMGAGNAQERKVVRQAVGQQLRRSKPAVRTEAAKRLAIMVKAERPQTQQDAAGALVALGRSAVRPVLATLAAARPGSQGTWMGRLEVVLGRIGAQAVEPLVKILRNAAVAPGQARAAVGGLAHIGRPAVAMLIQTLDWRRQFPHRAVDLAKAALVRIGVAAVPGLTALLKDRRGHRRLTAVELLGRIRDLLAVPGLSELVRKERDRTIRLAAVRALGVSGDSAAVAPILRALREDKARGKLTAGPWAAYREALVSLKVPNKTVDAMLRDKGAQVRLVGAQVAGRLPNAGAAVRAALIPLLKDHSGAVQRAAAQAIGQLRVRGATGPLRKLAYSRDVTLRRHVVTALGRIGDPKAHGVLLAAARYKRSYVVMTAAALALALGRLRAKIAIKTLRKIRNRYSYALRAAARWALGELNQTGKTATAPTLCGLVAKQRQSCQAKEPDADLGIDLESLCRYGSTGRLENLVRAGRCKQLQAALGKVAQARGKDVFVSWWDTGKRKKHAQVRFSAGLRQGEIRRWYATGKLQARGILHRGRRHGLWRTFWPNGKRQVRTRYRSGRVHGTWIAWHANGSVKSKGRYRYGKRQSTWQQFHPNNKPYLVLGYRKGKLHGPALSYYASGKPGSKALYVQGRRHGNWQTWYPDGKVRSRGHYHQGQRHGGWVWFHTTGKKRETGQFDKGKKTGTWKAFNAQGQVVQQCEYPPGGEPKCKL